MYACQRYGMMQLSEIAEYFYLNHPGSVSNVINDVRKQIDIGVDITEMKAVAEEITMEQLT